MNVVTKWCLLIMLSVGSLYSQASKILYLGDSLNQLDPIIMNDTTRFEVTVIVDDTSSANNDFTSGYLFYYYLTDSMISAGVPPRIITPNPDTVLINPVLIDTVPVDIRPDEIRTDPVNLIILWPGLHNSYFDIVDSDSVSIHIIVDGFLNTYSYPQVQAELFYPVPAMQFLYIRPEELQNIYKINVLGIKGELIREYLKDEIKKGYIYLNEIPVGPYIIETTFTNGKINRKKIIKN